MSGSSRQWAGRLGAVALAVTAGCTPTPETIIVIEKISAIGPQGDLVGDLFSDVCLGTPTACAVANDNAVVVMSARANNPFKDISRFGDIVLERYRVTYIRSDGRNQQGVDVPFSFDGAMSLRVPVNALPVSGEFMVVRPQAKLEPPLRNLALSGGALVFSVIAQIDFYGRQLVTDRTVAAHGSLNITFADYAN